MTFAELIRKWTEDCKSAAAHIGDDEPSLNELARNIGRHPNTLHYWLSGSSTPPSTQVPFVAKQLGVHEDIVRAAIEQSRAAEAPS